MIRIILGLMVSCNLNAQVMWQIKSDTVYKWFYKDGDEFNSVGLDNSKWQPGLPWGNFALSQDLYFAEDNIALKNGYLQLSAGNEPRSFPISANKQDSAMAVKNRKPIHDGRYNVQFTAGLITSRARYKYGYFEMRFKANEDKGIWPAFWLYGGSPNEEIDFFELKGERKDQLHLDVHCPEGCDNFRGGFLNLEKNWGGWLQLKESLANNWNIVSGEWQPGYVKFFLNGEPIAYFKGDFKTAQNLFINTSVAKDNGAFNPGPDATTHWPNSFLVDYVRIWSLQDTMVARSESKVFENTPATIVNNNLVSNALKKKKSFVYNKENLEQERGTLTLLPVGNNKYSLSVCGKKLGVITISVLNADTPVWNQTLPADAEYTLLDYSSFSPGKYTLIFHVLEHTFTQDIFIL